MLGWWNSTYLTPESEVLHFGFEVPDIGYLWPILTVEKDHLPDKQLHRYSII